MELTKLWTEHKKTIITTAIVVVIALLVIRFFDFIFWGCVLTALGVAGVIGWKHIEKKHGSVDAALKAMMKEIWSK